MFSAREYVKAKSLEEAWELNQKRSSVIVGGMMWLKMGNSQKGTVIDLSGLGLNTIEDRGEEISIGAMCTLRQLETDEGLERAFNGVFRECVRHIVGVQFRNGATVGGSVYGRYGFSDVLTCLLALDSYVELYRGGVVSLEEFAKMPYDRDVLVRIIVKKDGRKAAYVTQRNTKTDFPVIACAVSRKGDDWWVSVGEESGANPDKRGRKDGGSAGRRGRGTVFLRQQPAGKCRVPGPPGGGLCKTSDGDIGKGGGVEWRSQSH